MPAGPTWAGNVTSLPTWTGQATPTFWEAEVVGRQAPPAQPPVSDGRQAVGTCLTLYHYRCTPATHWAELERMAWCILHFPVILWEPRTSLGYTYQAGQQLDLDPLQRHATPHLNNVIATYASSVTYDDVADAFGAVTRSTAWQQTTVTRSPRSLQQHSTAAAATHSLTAYWRNILCRADVPARRY